MCYNCRKVVVMKLDRKQKKFLEKLAKNDVIVGYDNMQDFLNEYLDAFVKPKFKELKLRNISFSFVEKDAEQMLNEFINKTKTKGGYTRAISKLPNEEYSLSDEEIFFYKEEETGGVFDRSKILSLIQTLSHEYRHFVQTNVAIYNKKLDFSKNESKEYARFIKDYSQHVAEDSLVSDTLKIKPHDVEALYNMASRIDNAEFRFAHSLIGDKEDFDFPLYLSQSYEIDARQFALSCLKELWDCSHEIDVLRKNRFVADLGIFYDAEKEMESVNRHEATMFYLALEQLLDKINDEKFFADVIKVEHQELEKDKMEYYFANAPKFAQRLKLKQDVLEHLLDIQLKTLSREIKDDKEYKNACKSYYESIYKHYIQNGISYTFNVMDQFTEEGTYTKLLTELIEEGKPVCSNSFENFGNVLSIKEAEKIFKTLLDRDQIRYVGAAISSVDLEVRDCYTKKLLPLIKDKVNELNKQNLDVSYDKVDEMLQLINTIKYTSGLAYPPIDQYSDFDECRSDICKRYADKGFSEKEIGLLVDCEYSLELLGYEKVVQMRNGNAPSPDVYRFGHCQDRERYLLKGPAREEYVRQVYGEIELENRRYFYDTRDELERKKDPFADMLLERDPVDDLPERIY